MAYLRERWSEDARAPPEPPTKHADGRDDPPLAPVKSYTQTNVLGNPPPEIRPDCRDFLRGCCVRSNCAFRHPAKPSPIQADIDRRRASSKVTPFRETLRSIQTLIQEQRELSVLQAFAYKPPTQVAQPDGGKVNTKANSGKELAFDIHFKSTCKGPRELGMKRKWDKTASLTDPKNKTIASRARNIMIEKRDKFRGIDRDEYKEFMKPVRLYTWCHKCRSLWPNCARCAQREICGLPPETPPPAEQIIRENVHFFAKLLGIDQKPEPPPPKRRRAPKLPPDWEDRLKYPPGTERPEWDPKSVPDNTKYDSWSQVDTTVDLNSLWDQFLPSSSPPTDARQHGSKQQILATNRPTDHPEKNNRQSRDQSPNSASSASLESQKQSPQPTFVLGKRPESRSSEALYGGRIRTICFKCWKNGHVSRDCVIKTWCVRTQEEARVAAGSPLTPVWRDMLSRANIKPLEPKNLTTSKLQKNSHAILIPKQSGPKINKLNDEIGETTTITKNETISNAISRNIEKALGEGPDISKPLLEENNATPDAERGSLPPKNELLFKPENARYQPIGASPKIPNATGEPAIAKIPNEILLEIFKLIIEEDMMRGPLADEHDGIYSEETIVRRKNLNLDPLRKVNTLWRSLCQTEIYRTVPITSIRSLEQFARSVAANSDLAILVREVKIEIPFTRVDGWTPTDLIRTTEKEKLIAFNSAKYLSMIIASCPGLTNLIARFGGAFQGLLMLNKTYPNLNRLSLDDNIHRKLDVRGLWKATRYFSQLQLLQLEAGQEHIPEYRNLATIAADILPATITLTSLGLRNFPYIHDTLLCSLLQRLSSLKHLHIEQCIGITSRGLARAFSVLKTPEIRTLTYRAWRSPTGETKENVEIADCSHLCEILSAKLSRLLVALNLASVCVCEKLIDGTKWEALEAINIQSTCFKGCEPAMRFAYSQANYCDPTGKFCVSVVMPLTTAREDDGYMLIRVTGAAAKGWTAVGIGNRMAGSLMFIIYPGTASANVTVSPRLSSGQIAPHYYPQTDVTILEGSGIIDGQITALFTCSNCKRWAGGSLDVGNHASNWIWAQNQAQPLESSNLQENILQHDEDSYGVFTLDMTVAVVDDPNPPAPIPLNPQASGSLYTVPNELIKKRKDFIIAHAVVMSLAFVVLFPLGGIIIRLLRHTIRQAVYVHITLQVLSFSLSIVGLATGVMASDTLKSHFLYSHQFIGVVVMILLFFQVILGASHHIVFKAKRKRTWLSYCHIWLGRSAIIMGIVNGGLGLPLADASLPPKAIYAGCAAIVGAVYLLGYGAIKIWEHKMGIGKTDNEELRKKQLATARHVADGFDGFEMEEPEDTKHYEPFIYEIPGVFTIPPAVPDEVYIDPYFKGEYPPQTFSPQPMYATPQMDESPQVMQLPFSGADSQHDLGIFQDVKLKN
ncbi:hypothetical protein H072_5730 [Dactylellina haptotyla CBS 200.50]|uniref:CCHC-type domain-containing protein n=1 Tax=Dactylellina haptotyla (strain CBS 200.50) TaxID=1284197 RepID=S8BLV9_DACHA|nr:hypothetical protein H072_5730 [Dactylellina haptotyla CBS 200.50]